MPYNYETVKVDVLPDGVAHVQLNRPKKLNAFNNALIGEIGQAFRDVSADSTIRAVVLSGSGRLFTAGLDLAETSLKDSEGGDPARRSYHIRQHLRWFQESISAVELCEKPVVAAIHGGCYGAGVDLITACDIRYCTNDALFCVKEVDVGLAADVGTLQRLPKVIGNQSLVRELCLTARNLLADEAFQCGLVSQKHENKEKVLEAAFKTARLIASKSPVAIFGTKHNLNYARDHSVAEGLQYIQAWNAAYLNTEDIPLSIQAFIEKKPARYSHL